MQQYEQVFSILEPAKELDMWTFSDEIIYLAKRWRRFWRESILHSTHTQSAPPLPVSQL
jgi:hypothetical protein